MWIKTDNNELINLNAMTMIYMVQRGSVDTPTYLIVGKATGSNNVVLKESTDKKKIEVEYRNIEKMLLATERKKNQVFAGG